MSQQRSHPFLHQKEVVVPFNDLNPEIQGVIETINGLRHHRTMTGDINITMAGAFAIYQYLRGNPEFNLYNLGWAMFGAHMRTPVVRDIQKEHDQMKERPLIHSSAENKYPRDWIHASEIRRTHPIFYVRGNGDLVLVQPSRMEYFRYLFQHEWAKGKLGKNGVNMWRWRGYLEPPKAPESVKKWAREKLKKMMERMKPVARPVPRPAMVRVHDAKFTRTQPTPLRRQRIR